MSSSTDTSATTATPGAASVTATAAGSRTALTAPDLDDGSFAFRLDDGLVQAAIAEWRQKNPQSSTGQGGLHFTDHQDFRSKITSALAGRVFTDVELCPTGKRRQDGSEVFVFRHSVPMPRVTHPAEWHEGPCFSLTDSTSNEGISACLISKQSVPLHVQASLGVVRLTDTSIAGSIMPNSVIGGTLHLLHANEKAYPGEGGLWYAAETGTYDSEITKMNAPGGDQAEIWSTGSKLAEIAHFWFGRSTDSSGKTDGWFGEVDVRLNLLFAVRPAAVALTSAAQAASAASDVRTGQAGIKDEPDQDPVTISDH